MDVTVATQCIQATHNFRESIYTNICNGTVTHVATGQWDYFVAGCFAILGVCVILSAAAFTKWMFFGE